MDGGGDLVIQRPRVADAGRASVAHGIEAEVFEVPGEPGFRVVVGDNLGTGGQRGLDPRLRLEALLAGVARQQPRCEHHRGVGCVRA